MAGGRAGGLRGEADFRWRGTSGSRIEGLSDVVFALALTLLVVTLRVPRSFDEVLELLAAAPVFAVGFALLASCWCYQRRFQRRFGLEGGWTTLLELLFLFVVLLYVHPLRFLFELLFRGLRVDAPGEALLHVGGDPAPARIEAAQVPLLMVVYGLGFAVLFLLLAALNARAWSLRQELELDSVERVLTKSEVHGHLASAAVGLSSVALVLIVPRAAGWAGMLYFALAPLHVLHGRLTARAVARYRGKLPGAPLPS